MFRIHFIGRFISYLIMPAQHTHRNGALQPEGIRVQDITGENQHQIQGENNTTIDCTTYVHAEGAHPTKVIIHAVGNNDRYENHRIAYREEAQKYPNALIVAFNFRNVGNSQGIASSEKDWINDTLAVINHFRMQGFSTENILLAGHSLGAAILTLAAAKDYEQHGKQDCVRVLNDRTFSDLPTEITEGILGETGSVFLICLALLPFSLTATMVAALGLLITEYISPFSVCKEIMKGILKPLLWATFGTMDVASAYRALPNEAKDYVMAKGDRVIPPKASLHAALKKERKEAKRIAREAQDDDRLRDIQDCKLRGDHNFPLLHLHTRHKERLSTPEDFQNSPRRQLNGQEVVDNKTRKLLRI